MIEAKVRLNLNVPGAKRLSSQECEENPKKNYNEQNIIVRYTKGKGNHQKEAKKVITIRTKKQQMITQTINICAEAYQYMISTPTSPKLARPVKAQNGEHKLVRVWDTLPIRERLKHYFDSIAHDLHAVSYSYEVLGD